MTTAPVLAPTTPVVRLLGPFEMVGVDIPTTRRVRTVLALLAVQPGKPVQVQTIARELWGSDLPESWRQTVQTYILRLRQTRGIGPAGIGTSPSTAYALTLPGDVDVRRFFALCDRATTLAADRAREARDVLLAAFSLWRGDPLTDVERGPVLEQWAERIETRRRSARLLRFDLDIRAGLHHSVLDELRVEWWADQCREDVAALLMVALYRCQRRADALGIFSATRKALRDEHGLDPGPALQRLQQQILAGDPALELNGEH